MSQVNKKTLTAWCNEHLHSHVIFDSTALAESLKEETGLTACWPEHSTSSTMQAIRARGLGGELDLSATTPNAYGWEIAEALAEKYAGFPGSSYSGRGFRFRAAIEAIAKYEQKNQHHMQANGIVNAVESEQK